jgi:hypothetical protein
MIFASPDGPFLVPFSDILPRAFGPRDLRDWRSEPPDRE